MSSDSGKKNKLRIKNPIKLCPLRPATFAGQNAITTQRTKSMKAQIALIVTPKIVVANILSSVRL
jgi:hypothetical protein